MSEFSLEGQVAVIAGSSRDIGRAIALRLAQAGAKVVVSSRKLQNVQEVADEIAAAGGEALALQAHVGRPADVAALVQQTVETFGRVDVAINNAATNPHFGPMLTADEGQWDKILDTNAKGVFRVCKAVASHMEAQGSGKIINIASVAGLRPSPGMGVYGISKAAVIMLTKVLAMELGDANIQVNSIVPGLIKLALARCCGGRRTSPSRFSAACPWGVLANPRTWQGWLCTWPRQRPTMSPGHCSWWTGV